MIRLFFAVTFCVSLLSAAPRLAEPTGLVPLATTRLPPSSALQAGLPIYCASPLPILDEPDCPMDPACKLNVEMNFAIDVAEINEQACDAYWHGLSAWQETKELIEEWLDGCNAATGDDPACQVTADQLFALNDRQWQAVQDGILNWWNTEIDRLVIAAQRALADCCP